MLIYAINFLFGVCWFALKNTLQISVVEWGLIFAVFLAIFTTFKRYKSFSLNLMLVVLGFAWMGFVSTQVINSKVANDYLYKPILVKGEIVELPETTAHSTKFIFQAHHPFKGRLKLAWYSNRYKDTLTKSPDLHVGDIWQLKLKLKPNNGYQNLGGFDYERWLFYKRINATGYVRHSNDNQRINTQNFSIDKLRQNIRYALLPILKTKEFGGVINALIIGDRSLITDSQWSLFKSTNTTHLSVISGLHIGLISGFIFLLTQFFWRCCSRLMLIIPAQIVGAYSGIVVAFLYALVAGFSVPTIRAFIMASVVFVAIILRRHHDIWQLYGSALLLVLIYDPLSVFSVGFWLSFYMVAVIIYGVKQHQEKSWLYRLIYLQILVSFASLPLTIWFFSYATVLSSIANSIAIPVFSFITTPLSLVGALLFFMDFGYLSQLSFSIANESLVYLSMVLEQLQQFDFNQWHYTQTSRIDMLIFVVLALLVIAPKALKFRQIAIFAIILMLFAPEAQIDKNSMLVSVLDVGHGLAVVVQTRNHTLLFDTGAKYPSGFNLGQSVITPYLRAKRIQHLDKIIISHNSNDHSGGLSNILENFAVGEILTSTPEKLKTKASGCQSGQHWQWDGVRFEIFNPDRNINLHNNNASCVLKISNDKYSILLTGDIEKKAEHHLVENYQKKLSSTVMLAPHHGSKTSSTQAFLNAVSPSIVVASSGFKNYFQHPANVVIKRYQSNRIKLMQTSCSGEIEFFFGNTINIKEYRKTFARYYLRQCNTDFNNQYN